MMAMTVSLSMTARLPSLHDIDGVLNVNKPAGWTSHDVVAHLRRVLGISKIGHAGTLDPMATGVLPILIGKGTKIAQYLVEWDKEYRAVLRLGEKTDTQDATGSVVWRSSADVTEQDIHSVVGEFRGTIEQVPPMYSAVKVGGRPLYKAARKGRQVARASRAVTIYELEVLGIRGRDVDLRIVCSKGTYVRTLCEDIGERLKIGGHLRQLVRTRVGSYALDAALDVETITFRRIFDEPNRAWHTLDSALAAFPALFVTESGERRIRHGTGISLDFVRSDSQHVAQHLQYGQLVRLKQETARVLALGRVSADAARGRIISIANVFDAY